MNEKRRRSSKDIIIQHLRARVDSLETELAAVSADLLRARLEITALLERRNAA